eukprot:TRINITY_DN952_c1_g1_i1.p1 TRINITY_DN952_c1_g1~~TRINITY_DN952_c1_g1_i1.p1  ORF type:complete len:1249 (+),score=572.45 TRINITY_DN952_c1_g1_i1:205-3951(+)
MAPVRSAAGMSTPQKSTAALRTRTPPSSVRSARLERLATPGSARSARTATKRSGSCAAGKVSDVEPVTLFMEPGTPTQEKRKDKKKGDENIIVAVRVRSFNDKEVSQGHDLAIQMKDDTCFLSKNATEQHIPFTFDHCFWSLNNAPIQTETPYSDQQDVYSYLGVPVLENALAGFNSSIIAYGQTGSGKSYSIFGPPGSIGTPREGLIPRVCKELFNRLGELTEENPDTTYKVKATMMEVYMEKVHDLLNNRKTIKIRGDLQQGFSVPTFTVQKIRKMTPADDEKYKDMAVAVEVKTYKEIADILAKGEDKKTFACTALNERSSRAHTIFELKIQQFSTAKCGAQKTTTSKLTLCDLAGSERCKDAKTLTESKELQFKEACRINTSLLTLGSVVEKVANLKSASKIVPEFRNSVLTKLLMDCIGGNSKTVILTTIAPSTVDSHTSHQALRFADRAKSIKTHAVINEDSNAALMKQQMEELYKNKFMDLEKEYQLQKQQAALTEESVRLEAECARLQAEKEALEKQRIEMAKSGLTEAERRRLEVREAELSKRLSKVQAEFDAAQEKAAELERKHSDEVQNVRLEKQELDEEVSRLMAELDEERGKYQDALAEWEMLRDTMTADHKAQIAKLTEQHKETLAKQMEAFRKAGADNLTPLVEKVGKLTKESLNKETEWKAKLSERDNTIEELNGKVAALTNELKEANSKTLVLKSKLDQITDEAERVTDQLITAQEGSKLTSKLYEDLAEKDTRIKELDARLGDVKTVLQCEADNSDSDDLIGMIKSLVQGRRAAVQEKDAAMSKLNLEAKKYTMLQDKNETMVKAEKERHEAMVKTLKDKLESLKEANRSTEHDVEARLEAERAKVFEAVAATQQEMEKKMTALVAKHMDDIAQLNEQHKHSLDLSAEAHAESMDTLKRIHAQEKEGLEAGNADVESLLQELEERNGKLTQKNKDLADAERREKAAEAERDAAVAERDQAMKQVKAVEEMLEGVKKDLRLVKQEHAEECDNLRREARREADALRRSMEGKNTEALKKYDEERREMYQRTDREIEEVKEFEQRRVKTLKQDFEMKIDALEADKTRLSTENAELREQTQMLEVKIEKFMREARQYERLKLDDVEEAKTQLEAKYKQTVDELMAKVQSQQKAYASSLEAEKAKRKKLTAELEAAKQRERNSMQNLISMFQQTQNDFQARLQDEAAKKETPESPVEVESPATSPRTLSDSLSRSFADLINKHNGGLGVEGTMSP